MKNSIVYCVARAVSELIESWVRARDAISPKTRLPSRKRHTNNFFLMPLRSLLTAKVLQGSMQQPHYSTKTIFREWSDLVLFILSGMCGGYNMNIRCKACNQKFMLSKVCGINFSVWLCRRYAWYARLALFGISTIPPGTMGIPTLPPAGQKKVTLKRFNHLQQKLNFLRRRDEK